MSSSIKRIETRRLDICATICMRFVRCVRSSKRGMPALCAPERTGRIDPRDSSGTSHGLFFRSWIAHLDRGEGTTLQSLEDDLIPRRMRTLDLVRRAQPAGSSITSVLYQHPYQFFCRHCMSSCRIGHRCLNRGLPQWRSRTWHTL